METRRPAGRLCRQETWCLDQRDSIRFREMSGSNIELIDLQKGNTGQRMTQVSRLSPFWVVVRMGN